MKSTNACLPVQVTLAVLAGTAAAFLLLWFPPQLGAQPSQEIATVHTDELRSGDARTRDAAVDAILDDRKTVVRALIRMIEPGSASIYREETRCAAAYLLGELRDPEAVPVLSKALRNEPGRTITTDISRYDAPVSTALVKIGRPAVPAMIRNIESSDHRMLRIKSLDVLNHVLAGKRRLLELLAKLEARSTNERITERVGGAAKWARGHYKEDEEPLY